MTPTEAPRARRTVAAVLLAAALAACATSIERSEGMDSSSVAPDERADYALYADRCSKCHSLARSLNSGITDDGFWRMYVERMRRQPSSGIREEDMEPILRFLHWYSQKSKDGG